MKEIWIQGLRDKVQGSRLRNKQTGFAENYLCKIILVVNAAQSDTDERIATQPGCHEIPMLVFKTNKPNGYYGPGLNV